MTLRQTIASWIKLFGVNPGLTRQTLRTLPRFLAEERAFKAAMAEDPTAIPLGDRYPILGDYEDAAGAAKGHYFHMDLWAARRIHQAAPQRHVDVGSRIDGFVAHLLTFRPVEVLDIRPLQSRVAGLTFIQGDATELSGVADSAWPSISCLHAAEHFGLGRYGDPVDPLAYRRLILSLSRVLTPGGRLYFAVPIGRERVEFNAHRIFNPNRILEEFAALDLVAFGAVDDAGDYVEKASPDDFAAADQACGLFEFTKRT